MYIRMAGVGCLCVVMLCIVAKKLDAAMLTSDFDFKLQSYINETMRCRHIPGLTLAVVKDTGEWARGYGTADISNNRYVDEDTLFSIGSVTKSFTVTLLAILLTENKDGNISERFMVLFIKPVQPNSVVFSTTERFKLDWTAKVTDILGPGYRFVDDYRTRETTLKDLLSHRTGLANLDIGWTAGIPAALSRQEYCKRMAYLPEYLPFRDAGYYNNYMYMMAGHVIERLGGDSWEILMTSRLLQPLGMTSTRLLLNPSDVLQPNVARPYVYKDGRFQNGTLSLYSLHPIEPASAILSNAKDMTKYMKFHIAHGRTENGTQLADERFLTEAHTPVVAGGPVFTEPQFPISKTPMGIGYGWAVSTYRGYRQYWHGGSVISYITLLWIFPELKIGIFGSVNGPAIEENGNHALETIAYNIADHLLDLDPWLNETTSCTFPAPWIKPASTSPTATGKHVPLDDVTIDKYTGAFGNHYLPDVHVRKAGSQLNIDMNTIKGRLNATSTSNVFIFEVTEPWEVATVARENDVTFVVTYNISSTAATTMTFGYELDVVYTKGVSILDSP